MPKRQQMAERPAASHLMSTGGPRCSLSRQLCRLASSERAQVRKLPSNALTAERPCMPCRKCSGGLSRANGIAWPTATFQNAQLFTLHVWHCIWLNVSDINKLSHHCAFDLGFCMNNHMP